MSTLRDVTTHLNTTSLDNGKYVLLSSQNNITAKKRRHIGSTMHLTSGLSTWDIKRNYTAEFIETMRKQNRQNNTS